MNTPYHNAGLLLQRSENEEHLHGLERAIDAAHLYGAKIVATFAGTFEGKPVDNALPQFGKVFHGLAKRTQDYGVRLEIDNCPIARLAI